MVYMSILTEVLHGTSVREGISRLDYNSYMLNDWFVQETATKSRRKYGGIMHT